MVSTSLEFFKNAFSGIKKLVCRFSEGGQTKLVRGGIVLPVIFEDREGIVIHEVSNTEVEHKATSGANAMVAQTTVAVVGVTL